MTENDIQKYYCKEQFGKEENHQYDKGTVTYRLCKHKGDERHKNLYPGNCLNAKKGMYMFLKQKPEQETQKTDDDEKVVGGKRRKSKRRKSKRRKSKRRKSKRRKV